MNKCEILAPAGAREQAEAAIRAGADALYLGYGSFNARRNAKNFSGEELKDTIAYAHAHGVKVHVTVNTLMTDSETDALYNDLVTIAEAGADAVIVQDLGVARIIRKHFPFLEMHASTQLTVHNASGAKALEELGFKRVVLARELSLEEIRAIRKGTSLDIEVFIHGALCMCISGGCYLSSILGQRSGNRGLCAQPCRLDFKLNGKEYALSLKDMCHIKYINALRDAGVISFKIEGRMKRPEYVYSAVRACKDALEGKAPDIETLKAVFSRSGFTDGYITGKRNGDMFGYRRKEDVVAAEAVLKEIGQKYKNEVATVPLTVSGRFALNEESFITVSDGEHSVTVSGAVCEKAISRATEKADIEKQLSKTGGTPYYIESADIHVDPLISYPLSALNAMRREAIERLTLLRTEVKRVHIPPLETDAFTHLKRKNAIVVRVQSAQQLRHFAPDTAVIVPIDLIDETILARFQTVIGEIPSLVFPSDEEAVSKRLASLKKMGLKYTFIDNISGIRLTRDAELTPIGGWGLNVINSTATVALRELGVKAYVASFESSERIVRLLDNSLPVGIIGYGYLPLMRMRACPNAHKGCASCKGINKITDRMNVDFTLLCNNKRFVTLLNSLPVYVGDCNIQADFHLLYYTTESPDEAYGIYKKYISGEKPDFNRTKGLYYKNLK